MAATNATIYSSHKIKHNECSKNSRKQGTTKKARIIDNTNHLNTFNETYVRLS